MSEMTVDEITEIIRMRNIVRKMLFEHDIARMTDLLEVLIDDYSYTLWTITELRIYRALTSPHGWALLKAMCAQRGIDLNSYKWT